MAKRKTTTRRRPTGVARCQARSKVWFEMAGEHVFGHGQARLLESVGRLGSLQAAADEVKMSYRYAWELIRTAERRLGESLVVRRAGGSHGGGSALTPAGERMLEVFRRLNEDVAAFADDRFEELCNQEKLSAKD